MAGGNRRNVTRTFKLINMYKIFVANLKDLYTFYLVKDEFDSYRYDETNANLLKSFVETNVLFIHIPKTGGISVRDALFNNHSFGKHVEARLYRNYFGSKRFSRFFKIAFVRNPWSRVFSAYNFLKDGGINDLDKNFSERYLSNCVDFDDFVTRVLPLKEVQGYTHFVPQHCWVCDNRGRIIVDFLGRYENLSNDFNEIKRILKVSASLGHINKASVSSDYKEFYSNVSKDIVGRIYARDIKLFDYDF